MNYRVMNPATGESLEGYEEHSDTDVDTALERAEAAQRTWAASGFDERARILRDAGELLRSRADEWGARMTLEMGKPISQGRGEAEKCAWVCDYYAENAEDHLRRRTVETDASSSYWVPRPLGTVLGIMPWNFPFWQVFRFAAPTLMAGNAILLKHAPNVPGCAKMIADILREAGLPDGLYHDMRLSNDAVSTWMADSRIRAVTLTGSVGAGKAVARRAGELIKKTVLELGGSDPYVVLADADLELAAETCVTSRMINSGQSCIAAKRFIVDDEVHDDFLDLVIGKMRDYEMRDPTDEDSRLGPMAREDLRDGLHRQVADSVEAGATVHMGAEVPDRPGWWYPATVLSGVTHDMPAGSEELFGPVAAVLRAKGEDDAIRIANSTVYGLGAAVFTEDVERGERIARERLDAGACFVNGYVRSDPRLPFGGVGESGYGRELSPLGINEFVNQKTVWVR